MNALNRLRRLLCCVKGQDMVEYALLAGFLAVAAGAVLPGIHRDIEGIYERLGKTVSAAASSGGATSRTSQ